MLVAQGRTQPFPLILAPWDKLLVRWAGGEHRVQLDGAGTGTAPCVTSCLCHKALPDQGWQQKDENFACSCRSLLPILLKTSGEESPCTGTWDRADGLWQGEEERRAELDEPLLGAHEDWGSLHPISAAHSRVWVFPEQSMICPFSIGYRGAVPGAGSGEEEHCHRTYPGTITVLCFPIALVCVGTAPCQAPQQPKAPQSGEKGSPPLLMWAGKLRLAKCQSKRLLILI